MEDIFTDMGEQVNVLRNAYPKTLVFAEHIKTVATIYEELIVNIDLENESHVSMFHSEIGDELREYLMGEFTKVDSEVRVIICTVAFGMGVEIGDVCRVIHWGKSNSMLEYWQEVGRAGRDGEAAEAIWYPSSAGGRDGALFQELKKDKNACIRNNILNFFFIEGVGMTKLPARKGCAPRSSCGLCTCCSNCRNQCDLHH
jgi:superfamily II DNA helicase RecQ